jgi:hypothetical protein
MERVFRLKKDTPSVRKGTLYRYDVNKNYYKKDEGGRKFPPVPTATIGVHSRQAVEDNPEWFEEVFPLIPAYGTKEEVEKFNKSLRSK